MRAALIVTVASLALAPLSAAQDQKEPVPKGAQPDANLTKQPTTPEGTSDSKDPKVKRDVTQYNLAKDKPAIEGYDPVGYFKEGGGKPMKGTKELAYTYRGVTYYFATKENRDRFKKDPEKYEPAYGGWCASAIADGGRQVEIDPKNFKVTGDRLFLFYKGLLQDAKDFWNKDEKKHTDEADGWWKKIASEEPRKPAERRKKAEARPEPAPKQPKK
ncbi:MAG: YHS domain-containing (seleno)protein [Phycisphaerales bacterium]